MEQTQWDSWLHMQQQFMNQWATFAQPTERNTYMGVWRDLIRQSLHHLSTGADPIVRDVIMRLYASQTGLMRLMELSLKTWQKLLPRIHAGQDWVSVFHDEMTVIRAELIHEARAGLHLNGSVHQLWQAFLRDGQIFWFAPSTFSPMPAGEQSAWLEMTSTYWDAYRDTFGQLLRTPGLGQMYKIEEKLREAFSAWQAAQHAIFAYHVILTQVWLQAFERLIAELAQLAGEGEAVESVRDFLNRWSATADDLFKEALRGAEYVQAQGEVINTAMRYRQQQQQVNELIFALYDLPTRSEIDETHRRVHELRKEVKALRRELATLKADNAKFKMQNSE